MSLILLPYSHEVTLDRTEDVDGEHDVGRIGFLAVLLKYLAHALNCANNCRYGICIH